MWMIWKLQRNDDRFREEKLYFAPEITNALEDLYTAKVPSGDKLIADTFHYRQKWSSLYVV